MHFSTKLVIDLMFVSTASYHQISPKQTSAPADPTERRREPEYVDRRFGSWYNVPDKVDIGTEILEEPTTVVNCDWEISAANVRGRVCFRWYNHCP